MIRIWPQQPRSVLVGISSENVAACLARSLAETGHAPATLRSTAEVFAGIGAVGEELVLLGDQLASVDAAQVIDQAQSARHGCAIVAVVVEADHELANERLLAGADEILFLPCSDLEARRCIDSAWIRCRRRLSMAEAAVQDGGMDRDIEAFPSLDAVLQSAAAATHDLMAPLQTLAGYLDLLSEHADVQDRKVIARAICATTSMRGSIIDLLTLVRSSSTTRCSGQIVLADVVELTLSHLAAEIADLEVECSVGGIPPLNASSRIIARVLQNLVRNALRYVPGGTGSIVISATLDGGGKRAIITVDDNGPGVDPALRDRVFQPYHSDGSGLGIGLAFCRRAIAACGGEIWIEDHPGGGARFRFSLPLAAQQVVSRG